MDFTKSPGLGKDQAKLPRDYEAEKCLLSAVLFWPERAGEIVPLVEPDEMLDELHRKIWRGFQSQLALSGEIDALATGRRLGCCAYLCELYLEAVTCAWSSIMAGRVKEAAAGRALYDLLNKAESAVLRGHKPSAIIPRLNIALGSIGQGVCA